MRDDLDRQSETMRAALAAVTRRQAFSAARDMAGRHFRRLPNWQFAANLYALGPDYAHAICAEMGLDPDATTATPKPERQRGVIGDFNDLMRRAKKNRRA